MDPNTSGSNNDNKQPPKNVAIADVNELQQKVELQGYRFAIFALIFYFAVPILYYWAAVGYSPLNAFYVSI